MPSGGPAVQTESSRELWGTTVHRFGLDGRKLGATMGRGLAVIQNKSYPTTTLIYSGV